MYVCAQMFFLLILMSTFYKLFSVDRYSHFLIQRRTLPRWAINIWLHVCMSICAYRYTYLPDSNKSMHIRCFWSKILPRYLIFGQKLKCITYSHFDSSSLASLQTAPLYRIYELAQRDQTYQSEINFKSLCRKCDFQCP